MKKVLLLLIVPLLALMSSCSYDDSEIKDRLDDLDNKVTELEKLVKTLNSDMVALRELVDGKRFISDVKTNSDGSYTITLVTSSGETSTITIKDGADGKSPEIGVKQDTDGIYYWTLGGEFITAGGKKLPVTGNDGTTPQFKIENNNWFVSYDKGQTWTNCGKASYDTSIFKSVTLSEDGKQAIITLADGTVLTFDLYTGFGITFEADLAQTIRVGETLAIGFKLTGADAKTLIEVLPSGEWKATVERDGTTAGTINITAPDNSQTGKVVVLVNDGGTKTLMRTLTFVAGILDITSSSTEIQSGGGNATIEVETDLEFTVAIPEEAASWIKIQETRGAVHRETVTLNVSANSTPVERKATIELVSGTSTIESILIYQLPYYDPASMVLKVEAQASLNNVIFLPLFGAVNATVNWGDGKSDTIEASISTLAALVQHTYDKPGNYLVSIKGSVEQFNGKLIKAANAPGIVEVIQWGQLGLKSLSYAFTNNTKLVEVPLPEAGAFAEVTTAEYMFNGCTALESVPEQLFAGQNKITTVGTMFSGCKALTTVPEQFFANMPDLTAANNLFSNCTKIETLPAGLFANNAALDNVSSMFNGCTALTSIPENLFEKQVAATNFASLFSGCTKLATIPAKFFEKTTAASNFASIFKGCTALTSIPAGLFSSLTGLLNMSNLFSGCSNLENLPSDLFANQTKATNASYLFDGCAKMTEFPSLKQCTSVSNCAAIWKGCTSMVNAPADYFPESVKGGISAAYIFSGCTALKSVPAGLFKDFAGVTVISEMFLGCTALESLPVDIFDGMRKIKTASKTFNNCSNFTGESPYTVITVDNQPVKVHLYERADYPEEFVAVGADKTCFAGCTKMADYANIPIAYGGISDGTKAKPTITLSLTLTPGKEYYEMTAVIKGTEFKSGAYLFTSKEMLPVFLEEFNGDLNKVINRYGSAFNATTMNTIMSPQGLTLPAVVDANTEMVFYVRGVNAHGTTIENVECKSAVWPAGEANFDRYLGTWTVTSTSSELNKAPQTFTVTITPYRVNESYNIKGWGITTLGDEFPFRALYADGKITIPTKDSQGLYYPYYVYITTRFFNAATGKYYLWTPSTPLAGATYDTANNTITVKGEKFKDENEVEQTVCGLEYALYMGGVYYMGENLFKPGYTIGDYSVGPYTLTKVQGAPAKVAAAKAPVKLTLPGEAVSAPSIGQRAQGAYTVKIK